MTPQQFVAKWSKIQQKETAVSQSHFNDICRLVGHATRKSVLRAEIQELDYIHTALDHAVLDAYTWPHNLTGAELLERLLALNLERAQAQEE